MLGRQAEAGLWRALDPTLKVSAGGVIPFKQGQQKVSSAFWIAFPARRVEARGQRQRDLLGRCDRRPGKVGTSLAVQRFRSRASTVRGTGSIPRWGTTIPHAVQRSQKKKKKEGQART